MPVPTFDFTTRAVPVVQMGRFQRLFRGKDRWGAERNAGWGVARWGRGPGTLYEPVWADVTCDVHEVTTDTGRSSASDRFAPATASIIASNVTGWGDGEVPVRWPQFVDDFERTGPQIGGLWDRWVEMETLRPTLDELVIIDDRDSSFPAHPDIPTAPYLAGLAATVQVHPIGGTETFEGSSGNRWAAPYIGDHFVETLVSGLQAPEPVSPDARSLIELSLHLVTGDLTSQVAGFEWTPSTDPDVSGVLAWWLRRRAADGSWAAPAFVSGAIEIGPDGFPALLRFEADTDGTLRLSFDGRLLAKTIDPAPPTGQHVAIYGEFSAFAGESSEGTVRSGPVRFESVAAGSHAPNPIYLEPGALIRIGVYHQRYDYCWLFRGYVDALRPVYDPQRDDTVRIECIDALGEAGRLPVEDTQTAGGGIARDLEATDRVRYLLNEAGWPVELRRLDDDATILSTSWQEAMRVIDFLTQTAESCGGAVYGGPGNGCVVFRRKDWQGWDPDKDPVDGYITNRPGVDFAGLVVCPSGWERSWDRQDMTTRVAYSNQGEFSAQQPMALRDADAERRWGIESYERDLVTVRRYDMRVLAQRQLRLRGPDKFPRVEAVLFDAAVDDGTLDLMATATFTKPHHYQCQLDRPDGSHVFNQRMLVTGLRHVLTRERWTLRMALDLAAPFIAIGGQWSNPGKGRGRWGVDVWGHAR